MKISFDKYPIDIITCMLISIILVPVILLNIENTLRIILGLPFVIFIPGYILIFALFPTKKTDESIELLERFALSFGVSVAIIPLISLALNFTTFGIRTESVLSLVFLFNISVGIIAIIRWIKTDEENRFVIKIDIRFNKSKSKIDKILTLVLISSIIITISLSILLFITPKTGEKFTEFYILGASGIADDYPKDFEIQENKTITLGIINHEYKNINYTIEIWLINQSLGYNQTTEKNETIYHNMYFKDKFNITLSHIPINIEEKWSPQWEKMYNLSFNRKGEWKLSFLLFKEKTQDYNQSIDYFNVAEEKIKSAYRELYLWINVK